MKRLSEPGDRSGLRPDLVETVEKILTILNVATTPQALDLPRYRLHALKGNRQGEHAIRINDQYRLCFRWEGREAYDIEITDEITNETTNEIIKGSSE